MKHLFLCRTSLRQVFHVKHLGKRKGTGKPPFFPPPHRRERGAAGLTKSKSATNDTGRAVANARASAKTRKRKRRGGEGGKGKGERGKAGDGRREARNGGSPGLARLAVRCKSRFGTTRESAQLVVRRKSRFGAARGSAQIAKRTAETVSDDRFPCSRPVPRLVFEMSGK